MTDCSTLTANVVGNKTEIEQCYFVSVVRLQVGVAAVRRVDRVSVQLSLVQLRLVARIDQVRGLLLRLRQQTQRRTVLPYVFIHLFICQNVTYNIHGKFHNTTGRTDGRMCRTCVCP